MKKHMKKLISVMIITVLAAMMMTGCKKKATPENLFGDMAKNLKEIESASCNLKMEASVSESGYTMGFEMDVDVDTTKKPSASYMKGNVKIKVAGTDIGTEMESYQVKEDDEIVSYTKFEDEWTKEVSDAEEDVLDEGMFKKFKDVSEAFEVKKDKVEVNGKKCFELNGEIAGEALEGIIDEDMLNSIGAGSIVDAEELEKLVIPCTISIYSDDILPAKLTLDIADTLQGIMGEDAAGVEVEKYNIELTYKEFNKVEKIKVPKEAKGAAVKEDDADDGDAKAEKNIKPAEQSDSLGDNWNSYTVQINDKVVTLPCSIADIEAAGLALDKEMMPDDYVINAGEYVLGYFEDANGNEIMAHIINVEDEVKNAKDCLIGGISVNDYELEEGGLTVIFPGGVQIGSTKDEVLAKYGDTEDVYEGDTMHMYTWADESSYLKNCEIDFDPATGAVNGMSIQCYE